MNRDKRIFVLDDNPERHAFFSKAFQGCDLTQVFTFDAACNAVSTQLQFDTMFLDHDLNDFEAKSIDYGSAYGKQEFTGLSFVHWLVKQDPGKWPRHIVIHSWNPEGAAAMAQVLHTAGISFVRIPFTDIGM